MFERFTDQARQVLVGSLAEAADLRHDLTEPAHLLLALTKIASDGLDALRRLGVDPGAVRGHVLDALAPGTHEPDGHIPLSDATKRMLVRALVESQALGNNYIGTGHLALALADPSQDTGRILAELGVDLDQLRQVVAELHPRTALMLENLSEEAKLLALPAVGGREREVRRIIHLLAERGQHPILVGSPGIGRMSTVIMLVKNGFPTGNALHDAPILRTTAKLVSGFGPQEALSVATSGNPPAVIVVIGALETVTSEPELSVLLATLDAVTSRPGVHLVGTATPDWYDRFIAGHERLAAVCPRVTISEMTPDQATDALRVLAYDVGSRYHVRFLPSALATAAELAKRDHPDEYLPQSALHLLERAAAAAADKRATAWYQAMATIDTQLAGVRDELAAAGDSERAARLRFVETELMADRVRIAATGSGSQANQTLAEIRKAKEAAIDAGDFNQVKRLRDAELSLMDAETTSRTGPEMTISESRIREIAETGT